MPTESFANFDFNGFNGVLNGSDFNPVNKENISDRVIDKKDISGGIDIVGGAYSFVRGIFEKQAKETKKALNPEKYGKEEMLEKLNQVEETLEEKKKDLVAIKAKYNRLTKKVVLSKTEQKDLNTLDREINYLQREISELREIRDIALDDFSYGNYEAKSRADAGYNMDYQKFDDGTPNHVENSEQRISKLECVNKRLKKYINLFNKDEQQDNRRGEQSR